MGKKYVSFILALLITISAIIPAGTVQAAVSAITCTVTTAKSENPSISWNQVSGATEYVLYRKTPSDTKWVEIAATSKLSYTDKKWYAVPKAEIQYKVTAYKKADGKTVWKKGSAAKSWKVPAHPDMSKYIVYKYRQANNSKDQKVKLFDNYSSGDHGNPNTDASTTSGRVYHYYPHDNYPSFINVYEFTKRPSFAGEARTVTLSDQDLLPEKLLKYNLQVGDTVKTKSFTYEQDGNTKNGKEAIEWKVEKVQYIYTMYGTKFNYGEQKIRGKGANLSACYYFAAKNTLDYDEYFKFEDETKLYTGKSLKKQKYSNKYIADSFHKGFVFDSLQGADIDFSIYQTSYYDRYYWNTCNTTAYTGMMSIYKFAGKDTKSKPTEYALSKGIPTTKSGYVKYNWLYGTSPYYLGEKDISFRGLSVSDKGKLRWNHPFGDMSGYRPEMTLWTGIDTADIRAINTPYDITYEDLEDGSWRKLYETNYKVWKKLEDFVVWKMP